MDKMTLENMIVRMSPFPKELKELCFNDKEFSRALKINHPHRFVSLGAVSITHSPLVPNDEIIGFFSYDYGVKNGQFKQDFIVNIDGKHQNYILYTRCPSGCNSKKVKDINEFFSKYSKGQYYLETHHPRYEDLPNDIKPRAIEAIELANKLKGFLLVPPTDAELVRIDEELKKLGL